MRRLLLLGVRLGPRRAEDARLLVPALQLALVRLGRDWRGATRRRLRREGLHSQGQHGARLAFQRFPKGGRTQVSLFLGYIT